jgi:hypothetical protein
LRLFFETFKEIPNKKGHSLVEVMIATAILATTAVMISMGISQKREEISRFNNAGTCEVALSGLVSWVQKDANPQKATQYHYFPSEDHFREIPLPEAARFSKIKGYPYFQLIGKDPRRFHFKKSDDRQLVDMKRHDGLEEYFLLPNSVRTWQFLDSAISHFSYYYNLRNPNFCRNKVPVATSEESLDSYWGDYKDFLKKHLPQEAEDFVLKANIKRRLSNTKTNCKEQGSFEPVPLNVRNSEDFEKVKISASFDKFQRDKLLSQDPSMLDVNFELQYKLRGKLHACASQVRLTNQIDPIPPQLKAFGDCDFGTANMCIRSSAGTYKGDSYMNLCGLITNRPEFTLEMEAEEAGVSFFCRLKYQGKEANPAFYANDSGIFHCHLPAEFQHGMDPLLAAKGGGTILRSHSSKLRVNGIVLPLKMEYKVLSKTDCPMGDCNTNMKLHFSNLSEGEYLLEVFMVDPARNVSPVRKQSFTVELEEPNCKAFDKVNDCRLFHPVAWTDEDGTQCAEVPISVEKRVRTTRLRHGASFMGTSTYCPGNTKCSGFYRVVCQNGKLQTLERKCEIQGGSHF